MQELKLGVAYHGNRLLSNAERDMKDILRHNFNTVVHMFSHNDWDRSASVMKEIFDMTYSLGLDIWVDNWGLAGTPGDKSHFLCYHPEAHQIYSDGTMRPVNVCYNNPVFISWVKEWIDKVYGYVYKSTAKNLDICKKAGKNHNIWIQGFAIPKGQENNIIYAADAAYDAGARSIMMWGYRGSEGNDYRASNPELLWQKAGEAMARLQNKEYDRIEKESRKMLSL